MANDKDGCRICEPQWERVDPKRNLLVRCPACGYVTDWDLARGFDYCPGCGTRMHNFDNSLYGRSE